MAKASLPNCVNRNNGQFARDSIETCSSRFWSKVEKSNDPEGCWIWNGYLEVHGYGLTHLKSKNCLAHRAAWFYEYGVMPTKNLLHKCDNPPCVNPGHLLEGSQKQNMLDMVSKDRQARGERNRHAKLNNESVLEIRQMYANKISRRELVNTFQVSKATIDRIIRRETWKHI